MKCSIASWRYAALSFAPSFMLVSPAIAAAPKFHFTDLGTFGGRESRAYSINNRGQVVGYSQSHVTTVFRDYDWINQKWIEIPGAYDPENAFVYDHGKVTNLGRTNEASRAWAINNSGKIVGSVGSAGNTRRAFRTGQGPLIEKDELGFLDGSIQTSEAMAINDSGVIVGNTYAANGYASFIYRDDKMINAGPILGAPSATTAINNNGKIVGASYIPSQIQITHAYMQDATTLEAIDLGTIATKPYSTNWQGVQYANQSLAWDINDQNQVVGQSYIDVTGGPSNEHAFLWDQGVMKDLGTLSGGNESQAFAINNNGDVVGRSNFKAFLYTEGQMYDLNKLLDNKPSGWTIAEAWDINDYGQIVGFTSNGSDEHAFVLSPLSGVPTIDADPSIPLLKGTFSASYLSRPASGIVNLPGDANLDGVVNALDFDALAANFGMSSGATLSQGDFNGDGKVRTGDYNVLALHFGESRLPSSALGAAVVPEPMILGFLSAAGALMPRRRR